ncbi:MAG: zinc-binding alcohol dehydrogenase family protein [Candidatus Eremiobacteraeota bacterium]|nr:zinc-binding alcohol dehydrogenase family protein [Candidatus Eremiobacteraeota bacterium]
MKAVQIQRSGSLDDVAVRDVPDAPLNDGDVRIEIEAAGVNPSDVAAALGKFPQQTLPRVLGRDFAGRVVEGPPDVLGADVWGSGGAELGLTRDGSHAERLVVPAAAVVRRPPQLSAEQAAAAGLPYFTAHCAVVDVGALEAGHVAVVSGAAGAVGSAAVHLILALGGRPVALVRDGDDATQLRELGVPVARSGRDELASAVRDVSDGRGADLALNAVGAPIFSTLYDVLRKGGRMVVFSAAAGREATLDLFTLYRREITVTGLDTAASPLADVARTLEKLSPLLASGALKTPPIGARYALSEARIAYEAVQKGGAGKIVLLPHLTRE